MWDASRRIVCLLLDHIGPAWKGERGRREKVDENENRNRDGNGRLESSIRVRVRDDRKPFEEYILRIILCFQALQTAVIGTR